MRPAFKSQEQDGREQPPLVASQVQPQQVSLVEPPMNMVPDDLTSTVMTIYVQPPESLQQQARKLSIQSGNVPMKDVQYQVNFKTKALDLIVDQVGIEKASKYGMFECEWVVDEAEQSQSLGLDFQAFNKNRRPSQEKKQKTLLLRRRVLRQIDPEEHPQLLSLSWLFLVATGPIKRRKSSLSNDNVNIKVVTDNMEHSELTTMPPVNTSDGRSLHFIIRRISDGENHQLDQLRLQQYKRMSMDRLTSKLKQLETEELKAVTEVKRRFQSLKYWLNQQH